jgi:cellulose biosynthesis protein BcsQ
VLFMRPLLNILTSAHPPTDMFKGPLLQNAKVLIPFQRYNSDLNSLKITLGFIRSAQRRGRGIEFIGLFMSNDESARPINMKLRKEIEALTNGKLLRTTIHTAPELWDMLVEGIENFYQKKSKLAREFTALVRNLGKT